MRRFASWSIGRLCTFRSSNSIASTQLYHAAEEAIQNGTVERQNQPDHGATERAAPQQQKQQGQQQQQQAQQRQKQPQQAQQQRQQQQQRQKQPQQAQQQHQRQKQPQQAQQQHQRQQQPQRQDTVYKFFDYSKGICKFYFLDREQQQRSIVDVDENDVVPHDIEKGTLYFKHPAGKYKYRPLLAAAYDGSKRDGHSYEGQAVDCFRDCECCNINLSQLVYNAGGIETDGATCYGVALRPDMGTVVAAAIKGFSVSQLSEEHKDATNKWGRRVWKAEADIILVPQRSDNATNINMSTIRKGMTGLQKNGQGSMWKWDKESGKLKKCNAGALGDKCKVLVAEVTLPQSSVPYKVLQLERDLRVIYMAANRDDSGCIFPFPDDIEKVKRSLDSSGLKNAIPGIIKGCSPEDIITLIWFNGQKATLKKTVKELESLLGNITGFVLPHTKVFVVFQPYVSVPSRMATNTQLEELRTDFRRQLRAMENRLIQNITHILSKGNSTISSSPFGYPASSGAYADSPDHDYPADSPEHDYPADSPDHDYADSPDHDYPADSPDHDYADSPDHDYADSPDHDYPADSPDHDYADSPDHDYPASRSGVYDDSNCDMSRPTTSDGTVDD